MLAKITFNFPDVFHNYMDYGGFHERLPSISAFSKLLALIYFTLVFLGLSLPKL